MVMLQHKLSVKLSQRQILTPGLVQMVSVLALNKLELKDMINTEMVENPVLEELEESVPLLDEVGGKEADRERAASAATEENPIAAVEKKDPFEEIDFGSFFQDYLDPGYRSRGEMEEIERPSFENFLSKPGNLTDHLAWQLGALSLRREVREAADLIIGNLNEDGYLIASEDELLGVAPPASAEADAVTAKKIVSEAQALGLAEDGLPEEVLADEGLAEDGLAEAGLANDSLAGEVPPGTSAYDLTASGLTESAAAEGAPVERAMLETASPQKATDELSPLAEAHTSGPDPIVSFSMRSGDGAAAVAPAPEPDQPAPSPVWTHKFSAADLQEALDTVRQLDPPGVGCRDLRECLLYQLRYHQQQLALNKNGEKNGDKNGNGTPQILQDATAIVDQHLRAVQNKQHKEIARAIGRPLEAIENALNYIRTLDPRPGLRYNKT